MTIFSEKKIPFQIPLENLAEFLPLSTPLCCYIVGQYIQLNHDFALNEGNMKSLIGLYEKAS